MSDQKAFARFPAAGGSGAYQLIDIFAIEAIGQSTAPEMATIFTVGSERYYQVQVLRDELERAGEPDAASWCLSLVSKVSRLAHAVILDDSDEEPSSEDDDEDDFTEPLTKSNGEWA